MPIPPASRGIRRPGPYSWSAQEVSQIWMVSGCGVLLRLVDAAVIVGFMLAVARRFWKTLGKCLVAATVATVVRVVFRGREKFGVSAYVVTTDDGLVVAARVCV